MLALEVGQDQVRIGERFLLSFQRTLRIPDDGRVYPLPPGLEAFPVKRVIDFSDEAPDDWDRERGVFIPMYQREAMWLAFDAAYWKPNAVKVGAGRINALTGEDWDEALHADPQDYLVCPEQPWLDGFNTGQGVIRQFVAMPLGSGYTVEGQLAGKEEFGGLQIVVYEPKAGLFPDQPPSLYDLFQPEAIQSESMGLAAGGKLSQKIYPDPYGIHTWDRHHFGVLYVYILNNRQYQSLTGELPPPSPVTAQAYQAVKLPWFSLYDEEAGDLEPAENLAQLKSVKEKDIEKGFSPGEEETSFQVDAKQIKKLHRKR